MMKHLFCYKLNESAEKGGNKTHLQLVGYLNPVDKLNDNSVQEVSVVEIQHIDRVIFLKIAFKAYSWQQLDEVESLFESQSILIKYKECGRFECFLDGKYEMFEGLKITISWNDRITKNLSSLKYSEKHWWFCKNRIQEFKSVLPCQLPCWLELKSPIEVESGNENIRKFYTDSPREISVFDPQDGGKIFFDINLHVILSNVTGPVYLLNGEKPTISDYFDLSIKTNEYALGTFDCKKIDNKWLDEMRIVLVLNEHHQINIPNHVIIIDVKSLLPEKEFLQITKVPIVETDMIHWFFQHAICAEVYNHCKQQQLDIQNVLQYGFKYCEDMRPSFLLLRAFDLSNKFLTKLNFRKNQKITLDQERQLWKNFGRSIPLEIREISEFQSVPKDLVLTCQHCHKEIVVSYCTTEDEEDFSIDLCDTCGHNPTNDTNKVVENIKLQIVNLICKFDKEEEKEPFFAQLLQFRHIFNLKQAVDQSTGEQKLNHISKKGYIETKEKHRRLLVIIDEELKINRYHLKPFKYLTIQ